MQYLSKYTKFVSAPIKKKRQMKGIKAGFLRRSNEFHEPMLGNVSLRNISAAKDEGLYWDCKLHVN